MLRQPLQQHRRFRPRHRLDGAHHLGAIVSGFAHSSVIDTVVLITAWAVSLARFVPGFAVSVRRLPETDRSGYWLLLSFIPFGGLVLLTFCLPPTGLDNRCGPRVAPATRPAVGSPLAGWYPDPSDDSVQRYWDGSQWTQQTAGQGNTARASAHRRARVRRALGSSKQPDQRWPPCSRCLP